MKSDVSTESLFVITKKVYGGVTSTNIHSTRLSSKDRLLCIFSQQLLPIQKHLEVGGQGGVLLSKPFAHSVKVTGQQVRAPPPCLCCVLACFAVRLLGFYLCFLLATCFVVCLSYIRAYILLPDCHLMSHVNTIVFSTTLETNITQGRAITDANSWNNIRTLWDTGLKGIHVTFWQRKSLAAFW